MKELEKLTAKEVKQLEKDISEEIVKINEEACKKADEVFKKFKVKAKALMAIKIVSQSQYEEMQKEKQE